MDDFETDPTMDKAIRLLARNIELGNDRDSCRDEYVPSRLTEEQFFLAWHAAQILAVK